MYGHVERSVRTLQANPLWPYERKAVYVQRLIRNSTRMEMRSIQSA